MTKYSSFFIPGTPKGKGRPRFFRRGDHIGTYTPDATVSYEALVQFHAMQSGIQISDKPVRICMDAGCPIPASKPKSWQLLARAGVVFHQNKPDLDNILKIVMDALNGVAWKDDKQVFSASVTRVYTDTPGVSVTLEYHDPIA